MITTATIKSHCPNNSLTKIALSISGDTKFPLIFLEDENSALHIVNQLMSAEANEEDTSEIEIDGIIHFWNKNIKTAVDEALSEWLGDLLYSDEYTHMTNESDPTEEDIARWKCTFAETRKPANDPVFTY